MIILEKIVDAKLKFIEANAKMPDTIYMASIAKAYEGHFICGMEIKTNSALANDAMVICMASDLAFDEKLSPILTKQLTNHYT